MSCQALNTVGSAVGVAVVAATVVVGNAPVGDREATAMGSVSNIRAAIGLPNRIRLRRFGGNAMSRACRLGLGDGRRAHCWPFHCHLPSGEIPSFGVIFVPLTVKQLPSGEFRRRAITSA